MAASKHRATVHEKDGTARNGSVCIFSTQALSWEKGNMIYVFLLRVSQNNTTRHWRGREEPEVSLFGD